MGEQFGWSRKTVFNAIANWNWPDTLTRLVSLQRKNTSVHHTHRLTYITPNGKLWRFVLAEGIR